MTMEAFVAGERLFPRADRTLHWPAQGLLFLADPHFGKPDAFRASGIPLPGDVHSSLDRLSRAIRETAADHLVILGDFWHARSGRTPSLVEALRRWRTDWSTLSITVIRGNHDRSIPLPCGWGSWQEELVIHPFSLRHLPHPSSTGYTLAGHIHPGVVLRGRGRDRVSLPCFRFGPRVGILPAFGDFTGLATSPPRSDEAIFLIAEEEVISLSTESLPARMRTDK